MSAQKICRQILVSTALVGMAATALDGRAAEPEEGFALEEIKVTARLRSESFMDVPVAVNVFTEQMIEDAKIDKADDFIGLIPNVTIANSQDSGTSFITIRGLTQVRNGESPVAVVIDGVLTTNPAQTIQELFDIQQIEVLKGPQGALYGRNAIGGAITITTKQPTNEFEGLVRVGTGNGNRVRAQASISGPIIKDELFFRIAGSHLEYDGYIDNVFLGEKVDGFHDQSARALLKWLPSENITVDLRGSYSKTGGGALYFVVNSDLFVGGPDFFGDPDDTSVPIESNIRGIDDREIQDLSAKIDVETGVGTITSITAWNDVNVRSAGDAAPYSRTPDDGTQDGRVKTEAFSQELRLTSPGDQRLRYIVGAYYLNLKRNDLLTLGLDLGPGILIEGIRFNDPINPTTFALLADRDSDAYAGFAQVNYDVTEQIEISGAIRYDRDERIQDDLLDDPDAGERSADFSKWQPKVSITFKPNENFTLFGNYSQGFRSGGFNPPGVAEAAENFIVPVLGVQDIFEKETSETFEIGLKSQLLDGRLRVNAAAFMTDVKNQHYFSFISAIGAQIITNIDKVDLWGLEVEAYFRAAEGLDLYAALGVTDSEVKEYRVDPTAEGSWAPYVPKYTFNAGAQYRTPISGSINVMARIDWERRGKQYWEPNNILPRSSIDLVRARFGFESEEHGWSLMAWARNLFDEEYNEEFVAGGFVQLAQPRTYGLEFTKRF
ncbi:MAG: TonB-dependent receptor [Alphaproteobacteria bacterium]|nr:MAG: TonB-dependent receptor [Alphaproteobacteria bacterium]